jgi:hypothetical protein
MIRYSMTSNNPNFTLTISHKRAKYTQINGLIVRADKAVKGQKDPFYGDNPDTFKSSGSMEELFLDDLVDGELAAAV